MVCCVSIVPRLVWEAILLVLAVVVTAIAVAQGHFFAAGGMWPQFAADGLMAAGLALSLRTGTPNLAVAAIASLAQLVYVLLVDQRVPAAGAGAVALLAALALGSAMALVVRLAAVPAWAVSFAGIAIVEVVAYSQAATVPALPAGTPGPALFEVAAALFALGSVAGGLLWLRPAVRGAIGPTAPGPVRALVGLGGSSLLAGVAGLLLAGYTGMAGFVGDETVLLLVFGAVVLGGVSVRGQGGGIAGTVLGVYLLVAVEYAGAVHGGPLWLRRALPDTLAIVVGLLAGALLSRQGGRSQPSVAGSSHATSTTGPYRP